ncbi:MULTISPECIES: hypothetical protein [Prochlorococcus]|uniref:Uncharacterized protein n=1 Tax=Prochlorococcus marinus str. MIT 9116 TaxID=167544 RepID=A0A0A1ZZH6_PROMR|nr:hypothetical protein [Prochlorococcus marinus]KGF93528.1 hypothetical protein EU93_0157 [Prochlorococcus marinus str. MIT 9116]KGF94059.1 hypothetical protein EU94_0965 [Prochlorococcus marinus str. MIT 9123]
MRLIFYLFVFSQLFNLLDVLAEKINKEQSDKQIKWERIDDKESNNLKNIIWKSYNDDEIYFERKNYNNIDNSSDKKLFNKKTEKTKFINQQANKQELLEILPHIPLNNFLDSGDFILSSNLVSAFSGGAGGGTGHQNYGLKFHYGLSDYSLFSLYLSETDDPLYNLINGDLIPNNWASIALAYKNQIFKSEDSKNSLAFSSSLEYWVVSSGNGNKKSIYNETDNSFGHDRYEKFIYSFSFPFTRQLNNQIKFSIVPGMTFIPDKLGDKNIGKNFYGNNYFLASGINFDIANNFQLIGSYTNIVGPGDNSFDENLKFHRNSIYSYGFNWDVNPIIGIEGKITNGYGSTPSTSLLTIPSDNKPLYFLGGKYKPSLIDTQFVPLEKENKLLLFGGLTVNNALFPERGISQINFNYDEQGNLFAFYGYSLSNLFQLELSTGSFNDTNLINKDNSSLQSVYLNENTFNYRFGAKLLLFSPQKNDLFWMTLRTSLGRNEGANHQGYMFSELINTFRVNKWLVLNISPKYFFSGVENLGGLGISSNINLLENLQFIPEINTSLKNNSDLNTTYAFRYSYAKDKSVDLYYSNAPGIQDIGQLLENNEFRFGMRLNFLY